MAAVQAYSKASTLRFYEAIGIECWAIIEGSYLLDAGMDADKLEEYLTMLEEEGTTATYTLRLYNDCENPKLLDAKTTPSRGFKFKLSHVGRSQMGVISGPGMLGGSAGRLQQYLDGQLTKIIEDKLEGGGAKEKKTTWEDRIGAILDDPEKMLGVVQLLGAAKSFFNGTPMPQVMPAAIAGIRRAGAGKEEAAAADDDEGELSEAEEKALDAIDRLKQHDSSIVPHLEKLASLAEKKPDLFKMLIANLDGL